MGDGWEIENLSSENAESGHSTKTGHSVSQMRNNEGSLQELSKFDLDFKSRSRRRFSERTDIAHFDAILPRDTKTASSLQDVKQDQVQNREERILISSCGFVGNISAKRKFYNSETGLEATTFEEEGVPLKINSNMNMERETMSRNTPLSLKHQCSSLKDNENTEENNGSPRADFNEKNTKDFSDLSLEGKTNGHGAVVSSREETVGSTAACSEKHASRGTNSAEITQTKPRLQEKDNSKRKIISFRALVRMKGLGRRIRKKHQFTKKRDKYSNHRNDSGQIKEMKSDSSAKYLLESSTSTSEEQTLAQMKIAPRKEEPIASFHSSRKLQRSQSLNHYKDSISPNSDELSCSSSENNCSSGYLEHRRGAVCEELEKTLLCGEQSLADLRAILVVQQKLTGFGLL